MNQSQGVNFIFDVLFHVVMDKHPSVRAELENRLAHLYANFSYSQQQAVDEIFSSLFNQSFSECFNLPTQMGELTQKEMIFSVKYSNQNALPPLKQSHSH
ncbi:MAG: hypothetical protein COV52_01995 [Gammaproteobacteria bacterium CG11_big_fil_rev_8_21_14_0_20_46_22]|nr:MAG: hypothetical protein COW05_05890 [Gammaproteobacteria bacterium CG12_big_fil_rev_8_21_14_0_65_46_12]PIR11887.1 MAG: hypothetical protein COV52_01995 [Gammaproteobacteria bacterium CG11_big_fil_rev_8_21_14_0_20_46_22]